MSDQEYPVSEQVPTADELLADPASPRWLKEALTAALRMDPIAAANSAEILYRCLDARSHSILTGNGGV